jgi:hypothetical protein
MIKAHLFRSQCIFHLSDPQSLRFALVRKGFAEKTQFMNIRPKPISALAHGDSECAYWHIHQSTVLFPVCLNKCKNWSQTDVKSPSHRPFSKTLPIQSDLTDCGIEIRSEQGFIEEYSISDGKQSLPYDQIGQRHTRPTPAESRIPIVPSADKTPRQSRNRPRRSFDTAVVSHNKQWPL